MLHAYAHPIRIFELDEGFTMIIGANQAAIIYEIVRSGRRLRTGDRARDDSTQEVSGVMMPRSVQEILDHGDELARRFEDYEPTSEDERDPEAITQLRQAVAARSDAERSIVEAVQTAREHGYSWALIGSLIGTSGEAARQRYGHKRQA